MSPPSTTYAHYKDSGVAWLGPVPQHWKLQRLGSCFCPRKTRVNDREYPPLSVSKAGVVPQLEGAAKTDDGENRKLVCAGDFVINSRSDRRGSGGLSPCEGSVSQISIVLTPRNISGPFAHYLLRSRAFQEEFYRQGKGLVGDLWSTSYAAMKKILLPVPSPQEQDRIARYLQTETAKIDAIIKTQEKLVALLQEKQGALVDRAVTRGLDSTSPLRESGNNWLGPSPTHWTLRRLKQCVQAGTSISYGIVQPGEPLETGVPFLQSTNLSRANFERSSLQKTTAQIAHAHPRSQLCGGEVILGIRASIGAAFVVPKHLAGANLSRGIARIVPNALVDPAFLVWYLRSETALRYWRRSCQGSTFNEVSIETVKRLALPLPPKEEQRRIASFLCDQERTIGKLIDAAKRQSRLLEERKAALICAAVTGKIDLGPQDLQAR